ncbi:MAG: hypothetical protein H6574_17605 [Lewinellaceae bacterium]|nr:hypothetical protein [Lewinellaceae bacterium]
MVGPGPFFSTAATPVRPNAFRHLKAGTAQLGSLFFGCPMAFQTELGVPVVVAKKFKIVRVLRLNQRLDVLMQAGICVVRLHSATNYGIAPTSSGAVPFRQILLDLFPTELL